MENKQTAMQQLWDWIDANYHEESFNINDARDMSMEMEKKQHGETWDSALSAYKARGGNVVRAIVDFDDYWEQK
jgi:hypothetical protein